MNRLPPPSNKETIRFILRLLALAGGVVLYLLPFIPITFTIWLILAAYATFYKEYMPTTPGAMENYMEETQKLDQRKAAYIGRNPVRWRLGAASGDKQALLSPPSHYALAGLTCAIITIGIELVFLYASVRTGTLLNIEPLSNKTPIVLLIGPLFGWLISAALVTTEHRSFTNPDTHEQLSAPHTIVEEGWPSVLPWIILGRSHWSKTGEGTNILKTIPYKLWTLIKHIPTKLKRGKQEDLVEEVMSATQPDETPISLSRLMSMRALERETYAHELEDIERGRRGSMEAMSPSLRHFQPLEELEPDETNFFIKALSILKAPIMFIWQIVKKIYQFGKRLIALAPAIILTIIMLGALLAQHPIGTEYALWTGFWGPTIILTGIGLLRIGKKTFAEPISNQLAAWEHKCSQISNWRLYWLQLRGAQEGRTPIYIQEVDYPQGSDNPTYRQIMFRLVAGKSYTDYLDAAPNLASAINKNMITIEPCQVRDADEYSTGEAHAIFISLSHELELPRSGGVPPYLDSTLDPHTLNFAAKHALISTFRELKLGTPLFLGLNKLTPDNSELMVVETLWSLLEGMTIDQYAQKTSKLRERLGCEWCRVTVKEGYEYLSVFYGAQPLNAKFKSDEAALDVFKADWSFTMLAAGLQSPANQRPPALIRKTINSQGLTELDFELQPGISAEDFIAAVPKLQPISRWPYLTAYNSKDNPNTMKLIGGARDPLADSYLFVDYEDQLIQEPKRGHPNLTWTVGIGADGEPVEFNFEAEDPHLLIAGTTGSGKSGVVNSMMLQLLLNNHTSDMQLWCAEPKVELQAYQHLAHVKRFVGRDVIGSSEYAAIRVLLEEAYSEMCRRNSLMGTHPDRPQKLSEARHLAMLDPKVNKELALPYIIMVLEECSSYFAKPDSGNKDDKEEYDRICWLISELARKARSAGIFMVYVTQYPVAKNVPQVLKMNSRRLGLKCSGQVGSLVIIDQGGLELIRSPGRGKVSSPAGGYVDFRGFFFQRSTEGQREDMIDERADYIRKLPADRVWPKLSYGSVPAVEFVGLPVIWPDGTRHNPLVPKWVLETAETMRAAQAEETAASSNGHHKSQDSLLEATR